MATPYMETLVRSATGAVAPWNSLDATIEDMRRKRTGVVYTDQREIDICLNCPYPACHNCVDAWKNAFGNIRSRKRKRF